MMNGLFPWHTLVHSTVVVGKEEEERVVVGNVDPRPTTKRMICSSPSFVFAFTLCNPNPITFSLCLFFQGPKSWSWRQKAKTTTPSSTPTKPKMGDPLKIHWHLELRKKSLTCAGWLLTKYILCTTLCLKPPSHHQTRMGFSDQIS